MSSRKDPELPAKPKSGFSRRGFIRGVGIGSGALGTGLLEKEAAAEPAAAGLVGPGPVPITLNINGKPLNLTVEPRVTLIRRAAQPSRHYRRQARLRPRHLRRLHRHAQRQDACTAAPCWPSTPKARKSKPSKACRRQQHPVSAAFVDHDGQQCGYCTPGFVMASKAFLDENPNPTEEQVKQGLGGNLCRCGTYMGIRKAVLEAAKTMKGGKNG